MIDLSWGVGGRGRIMECIEEGKRGRMEGRDEVRRRGAAERMALEVEKALNN